MSKNIDQVFTANPITSNASTDLMYFGQSPYGAGDDAAMTFANFAAQFGAPYTAAALTAANDTNVTLTLGGTPATALLHASSITAGWTGQLSLTRGGTNSNLTASAGSVAYSTASAIALTAAGSSGQLLASAGSGTPVWTTNTFPSTDSKGDILYASAANTISGLAIGNTGNILTVASGLPAWTTATYPATTTINQLLYSSSANTVAGLSTLNNGVLTTGATGIPAWLANSATPGFVLTANSGAPPSWQSITAEGAITTINGDSGSATPSGGAVTVSGGSTGLTTSGSSSTLSLTGTLKLTNGGTNNSLTASNGGIVWSDATKLNILAGTATSNLPLLSGSSVTPSWGAFALSLGGALTTAGALTTSGAFGATFTFTNTTSVTFPTSGTLATTSQIPTGAALTEVDDTNVTLTLGGNASTALVNAASITAGWTGTLSGTRGGTGVNNGASTATYAGNLNFAAAFSTSGAFAVTQTYTGITNVTFPTSGTLATTAGSLSTVNTDSGAATVSAGAITVSGGTTGLTTSGSSSTVNLTGTLKLANGGTNASLTASNGGIFYSTGTAGAILAGTATANQVLLSGASTTPAWSTAIYPSAVGAAGTILRSNGSTGWATSTVTINNTFSINTLVFAGAANQLSGLSTTNSAALSTNATGVPTWLALTDGQVVIGSSAGAPAAATLSAGTGVTITNGHNTITVASNGANPWVDQTSASVTMATNTGYTSDDGATLVTFTLPTASAIGDWVEINGKGSGLWTIAQASGQQIHFGSSATTSGASGTLSSTLQYDCVRLRCITANTIWVVVSVQGNLTVV
jgi:hypothetical protein